jgi:hypothetical protein
LASITNEPSSALSHLNQLATQSEKIEKSHKKKQEEKPFKNTQLTSKPPKKNFGIKDREEFQKRKKKKSQPSKALYQDAWTLGKLNG